MGQLFAQEKSILSEKELLTLEISNIDMGITYLRYQVDGEKLHNWNKFDISSPRIIGTVTDFLQNIIYIQQSYDGLTWSPSSLFQYNEEKERWVLLQDEQRDKKDLLVDIELLAHIPFGIYGEYYKAGIGGQVHIRTLFANNISIGIAGGYTFGLTDTFRVNQFHKVNLIGTAGYTLPLNKILSLTPEVGLGVLFHIPVGSVYSQPIGNVHLFVDFVAQAGVDINVKVNNKTSLYINPRIILFPQVEALGILGEISIGTSITY